MDRDELNDRVHRCLQEISVLMDDGDRDAMRQIGLTPTHFSLLRMLEANPSSATGHTITRLAELTLCTRGNVTRLVQRLVDAGLVEIRQDRSDQRLVRVFLTEFGAGRLAAARASHTALNEARLAGIRDEDMGQLLSQLTTVAQQLRKHLSQR